MKAPIVKLLLCLILLSSADSPVSALEERAVEELTCRPVNGAIDLPGIAYDDLTPLAREVFDSNPADVSDALYALSSQERSDFLELYLEPFARERHQYFFSRCMNLAENRALRNGPATGERIPGRLRAELAERERSRIALREGAVSFRIGERAVYIPVPAGYVRESGALFGYLRDAGVADSLAVFGRERDGVRSRPNIIAVVQQVRAGSGSFDMVLQAYRTIVDNGWRPVSAELDGALGRTPVVTDYRWNLQPFAVRGHSFCQGRFDKVVDVNGSEQHIRYRATAFVILPGSTIQVSIAHSGHTDLDTVDAMNADLVAWRDDIMAVNWID